MPWDGKSIKKMLADIVFLTQPSGDGVDLPKKTWPTFDRLRAVIQSKLKKKEGLPLCLDAMKISSKTYSSESKPVRDQRLSIYDRSSLFFSPPVLAMAEEKDMDRVLARTNSQVRSAYLISFKFSHLSSFIIIMTVIVVILDVPTGGPYDSRANSAGRQDPEAIRPRPRHSGHEGPEVTTSKTLDTTFDLEYFNWYPLKM